MEARNWGSSFNFSRPPMHYPMPYSDMPFHRMNEEFRMPPNFPSYSRPPSYHDDNDFDNNHDVRGSAFWGAPARFESSQSWRPRQKKKTFASPIIKPYVKPEDKSKRGKGKDSQEPNSSGASQASTSEVTQTRTSNGNTRKYKAGETRDADVPTQPNKKFKTKEPTVSTEKPNVVNSSATESDAKGMYSCSLCKFETLEEKEIQRHFYSFLHREVLQHLYIFFPKKRVDFLHEYLLFKKKKMSIQQKNSSLQPFKDVFKGIGQDHYLHRVQATHCEACDVLIPYVQELVAEHVQSEAHEQNRKLMLKNTKANSLAAAKTLLVDKEVVEMLTKLHMKQNPFKETAGRSLKVGTDEILVAEEDDFFDFAYDEDSIYDEDQEVAVDHNEGPAQEKKPPPKKSPPNKPEMIKPETSSATVSSLTVPPEIEEEEEEEEEDDDDEEEAAEAP